MDWPTIILTSFIALIGIYYTFGKKSNKFDKFGIPYIKPWPIFGNGLMAFVRRVHIVEIMDNIYRLNDEAKYVGFFDMMKPTLILRSSDLIKSVMVKNFDHFMDRRGFGNAEHDVMFSKNLFSLKGEKWKQMRSILSPAFTGSKMRTMYKLMSDCGKNFADFFVEKSARDSNPIDAKDAFTRYTNDVIATCAFGISVDSLRNPNNDFYQRGKKLMEFDSLSSTLKIITMEIAPKIAKYMKLKIIADETEVFFESVVRETIETRDREGINRPDMLQLMMETRKHKSENGVDLTIQDMTAQALIFFFGGFESSATAMCFIAYEIAANPDIQEKLRKEVDKVMKESNGEPSYEAVNDMQLLEAVITETLRLYPVNGFLERECVKSFDLPATLPGSEPITVKVGDTILVPAYSVQRDPRNFPDPDKFDPERFMGSAKNDLDIFTFLAFGQGPRMCIANRFAILEIKVVMFHLLSKCNLRLSNKMLLPLRLSKSTFMMKPEGGFWLEFESRNNQK